MELFIGTSLSMCVASILRGNVKLTQVYGIISGTCIKDDLAMIEVMEQYAEYAWEEWKWDEFEPIVWELFHNRLFWQPRLTHGMTYTGGKELWERIRVSEKYHWHPDPNLTETTHSGILLRGDAFYDHLDYSDTVLDTPNKVLGEAVLGAWRAYCMESWIFRLFVKLGWRK